MVPPPPRPRSMLPAKRPLRRGKFERFLRATAKKWDGADVAPKGIVVAPTGRAYTPQVAVYAPRLSKQKIKNILSIGIIVLLAYGALVGAAGKQFYPPKGPFFTILLVWSSAHLGGLLLSRLVPVMPPLLGMLAAGILLRNVPGDAASGLSDKAASKIRYGCLAVIFLRSGLEQDPQVFRKVGAVAVRLLLVPGIIEALVAGGVAAAIFKMPALFAIAVGFILKPCDPAIVISTMCGYQERGAGVKAGLPSLIVAAASFDDIVAIALYTVFVTLAVPSSSSGADARAKAWSIAAAPMQLVFGLVLGLAGAAVCSATRVFDTPRLRASAVLLCALAQMYFMVHFKFAGAGVLSAIVLGVSVAQLWSRGFPRFLSRGPNETLATVVEHQVDAIWNFVAAPLLFGLVGTQVQFAKIPPAAVPRSLAVIAAGWAARMPATFFSTSFSHLTTKQKLFVTLNWLPKATVQAALAAAPLERVEQEMSPEKSGAGEFERYRLFGEDALVTILLSVLVCGPLGVTLVALFGPMLVKPDVEEGGGGGGGEGEERGRDAKAALPSAAASNASSSSLRGGRRASSSSGGGGSGGVSGGGGGGGGGHHLRRLGSDAASALAAMPAESLRGRAWQLVSMPTVLPAFSRGGGGGGGGARGGAAAVGGGSQRKKKKMEKTKRVGGGVEGSLFPSVSSPFSTDGAAAEAEKGRDDGGGGEEEENDVNDEYEYEYDDDDENDIRSEEVDDAYADALLADTDPLLHSLLRDVELEAWSLEASEAPLGRAAASAAAARLRDASSGLRRRLLEREPGRIASVDGAREFFRRLRTVEVAASEERARGGGGGGGGGGDGGSGGSDDGAV